MLLHLFEIHIFRVLFVKEGLLVFRWVGFGLLRLLRTLLRLVLLGLLLSATQSPAQHKQKPKASTKGRQHDDHEQEQQRLH